VRLPYPERISTNDVLPQTDEITRPDTLSLSSRTHLTAMDGVRGLAIFAVLLYHGTVGSIRAKGFGLLLLGSIFHMGWLGVDLFFGLSGFLITGILLDTTHDPRYFRTFYLRRALRIFPLYYGILLAFAVLTIPLAIRWNGTAGYLLLYLQNYIGYGRLTLATRFMPIHLEHLWSLAVEEQFYLIWPAVVWVFRREGNVIGAALFVVIACPTLRYFYFDHGGFLQSAYLWTPFRADALAWGAIAAWLARYRPRWVGAVGAMLLVCGSVATALVMFRSGGFDQYNINVIRFGYSATGATFSGLLLRLLMPDSIIAKGFRNKQLRWLGKYSYGIYVYHYLFIDIYSRIREQIIMATGSRTLGAAGFLASLMLTGTLAAYVSYNAYEKHWLRLKNRVARYKEQATPKTA
jgi:peptidoglycan/LPS O-acetylase OafA/YrhL